jgi:hypothetical protein
MCDLNHYLHSGPFVIFLIIWNRTIDVIKIFLDCVMFKIKQL